VIVSAHDGYPRHVSSGADFIEVDIRRTPKGVVVLAHEALRWWRRYARFDEVLERVPSTVGLHLDLKEPGYERELLDRVLAKWPAQKVVVTPEIEASAHAIKASHPEVRVSPLDLITLDQRYATDKALASAVKPVWVWTVDDERQMKRFIDEGRVAAIVTNRPERALELRKARA
jgi:glycerophosphoryl diester phosphodiesterase